MSFNEWSYVKSCYPHVNDITTCRGVITLYVRIRTHVYTSISLCTSYIRECVCVCVFQSANSNKSQVTLRNVDYGLSGTFSCEVTADAPTFSTASVSKNLTVVCKYMLRGITRVSRETPRMHQAD